MSALLLLAAGAMLGRAADGDEVVMDRLYPKAHTVEVETNVGWILNPTFVDTLLVGGGLGYHWSETWGLGVSYAAALTKDRAERTCIESFYNDPSHAASAPCASEDGGAALSPGNGVNLGPAYVPIRELKGLATASLDYTLAYGKQILMLGAVNHFDLRLRFGAGVAMSTVYDEQTTERNDPNRPSRGDPATSGGSVQGVDGRPDPRAETAPVIMIGLQEQMDFLRRFYVSGEMTAYVTTGVAGGVDPFFVAQVALGMRL